MTLSRIECSMSGERVEIQQIAYINGDGVLVVLDAQNDVPGGYTPATDEQIEAHRNPPVAPLTHEQVEALRLTSYANPITGSDRYFAEAARMHAMSEEGWEIVRASGVARFEEIQAEYPWP